jgi:hypothetical protein
VNDKQVNDARTLDGLGALAVSCPKLADEPLRDSVVANHGSSKNTRAREDGAKPAKPAKAAKEGQQTGLSPGALPNTGQASHPANWDAEDWRARFDERAGFLEHDGGLLRAKAEFQAFDYCVVEWLNQHPAPSAPGRCAWCGRPECASAVVVPFGTEPGMHAWLHPGCWPAWYQRRREEAVLALTGMGITMGTNPAKQLPSDEPPAKPVEPPAEAPQPQMETRASNGIPEDRRGFVGYVDGRFVHYCPECGEWGAHGIGVFLRRGQLGVWYCAEHKPKR